MERAPCIGLSGVNGSQRRVFPWATVTFINDAPEPPVMECPRCQHENEAGAQFCEECAASLGEPGVGKSRLVWEDDRRHKTDDEDADDEHDAFRRDTRLL